MSFRWKKVLLAGLLASGFAGGAQASSVSYTGGFSGLTDVADKVIPVAQFDPALGTLQSALFVLTARTDVSVFSTNDGNFSAVWDIYADRFSLAGSAGYAGVALAASLAPTRVVGTGSAAIGTLDAFTNGQKITASSPFEHYTGQGRTASGTLVNFYEWDYAGPTLSASQSFTAGPLADFIGTGSLSFLLSTFNREGISVGGLQTQGLPGPAWSGTHADVVASVSVTYDYLPFAAADAAHVPEPAPYALMGVGLGLAGFLRASGRR